MNFLSRHYRPFRIRMYMPVAAMFSPNANHPTASLAALLDVRTDEFLGVLLEHLIDLVEDRVHVVGQLLVPLLGLIGRRGLVFFGLLGAPGRLPLASGVLRCHLRYLRPSRGAPPSTAPTLSSPARV